MKRRPIIRFLRGALAVTTVAVLLALLLAMVIAVWYGGFQP